MLKVPSDALLVAYLDEMTLLCLIDLSAAFDTVNYDIFIDRLQTAFGIHSTVLSRISSFRKDRTQRFFFFGARSNTSDVRCDVSKGNVLGLVLFPLYMAEVTAITR